MKYNHVGLYGIALRAPKFVYDENGVAKKAILPLSVVKGVRHTGDNSVQLKQNVPVIMSRNPGVIESMRGIEPFDSVLVKGVFVNEPYPKKATCPGCGYVHVMDGVASYVAPIHIESVKKNMDMRTAMDDLTVHREISNEVQLVGHLCTDVIPVPAATSTPIVQYRLSVARTYRIDGTEKDYPWIKSYGANAKQDAKHLKRGSAVLIDGVLQARNVLRHISCPSCGAYYDWANDATLEIVPYETEYLNDFISDEDSQLAGALSSSNEGQE